MTEPLGHPPTRPRPVPPANGPHAKRASHVELPLMLARQNQNTSKNGPNSYRPTAARHIGYVSREEYEVQLADIFDQITAYAARAPINVVNPEVLGTA
jgi:hypothetical protein